MPKEKTNIQMRQMALHWLRDCLTCVAEALVWTGCLYAATLSLSIKTSAVESRVWLMFFCWGLVFQIIATRLIPNNAYSRTARRDEVVALAMKTALAFCMFAFIAFTERDSLQLLACLFFCVTLTIERLILNSWFIRYSMHHHEQGVIICNEDSAWQQKALQQNTYGLKLVRLEEQTVRQLEEYLASHPETESVYCAPSALQAAETEDIAHTCRKRGLTLHFLPLAPCTLPQMMRSECRGTIGVLSPANPPLQSLVNRTIKRLTDIVLSLVVLLTIFPAFAVVAFICIKRQSQGPVLVARHLCGMNGKPFRSLTFRTRHHEAAPSFLEGINDPGYFPFGKFLKHSRLELMPQFLCVLWGSMTIVGSQAIPPERYTNYRHELRQLFASNCQLKAGITSYHFPMQTDSAQADVWYCRNWGFWLDMRIMLQRLGTLLSKSKAKSINYI